MKQDPVYADIQQSTTPPAAPPPTQPVVYAEVKQSNSPPAAPPPTELKTVLYTIVNNPRTIDDLAIECCDHLQKVYMLVKVVISVVSKVFEFKFF